MNIAKLEPLLKLLHRGKGYLVRIWNFLHGVLTRMGVAPKIATPLLIMLLAIFAFIVLVSLKPKTQASRGVERIWSVRALSVELADSQPDIVVFGEIFAAREVSFRALVAGEIIEVWPEFEQGALVKKDQKLLRIDPFYYERILIEAEASLRETRSLLRERNAKLKQANIGLERALKLRKKGTVAQKYVDDKATDVEIFQSRYDQTASVLVRRESSVARAERDFKNTLITAPFDGVLSNLNVREGRRVNV
ncbi:MAG: efflux RND transporter periplasmic adaptor subunit, partial [Parvibaculales bacterium]